MDWLESLQSIMTENQIQLYDLIVLSVNIILILSAKKLMALIYHGSTDDNYFLFKVRIIRVLNLFILIFYSFELFSSVPYEGAAGKVIYIVALCYLGYLSQYLMQFFIHRRYGKKREIDDKVVHIETYNTRLLSIFSGVFIFIIVLISSIHILDLDSLLEAGGVIGFIGVFLALTQGAWAPDIISGLIILNSNMMEEGDVVELDGMTRMSAIVYKTRVFHTELLNVVNNHRLMLKNSKLREYAIHNLSKFASAKGLREQLSFNISYDVNEQSVRDCFERAYETCKEQGDIKIELQYPLEIGVTRTGDYAVEWTIYYYIKEVRDLMKIRMAFREIILKQSKLSKISLATPSLHELDSVNRFKNPAESSLT